MDKGLKLHIRSLAEIPADCAAQALWLTTEELWLDSEDLPSLPALKALCIPKRYLRQPWNLPELPELVCLWVGYHDTVDDLGDLMDREWMQQRFPKLRIFLSNTRYYVYEERYKESEIYTRVPGLWTQMADCFLASETPLITLPGQNHRRLKTHFEKLTAEPIPIRAYSSEFHPRYWVTDDSFIDLCTWPLALSAEPELRLLYTADALYLAYPIWKGEGIWEATSWNCRSTGTWAGIEVQFRFEDFWDTDGTLMKDGILQMDWIAMLKQPIHLYRFWPDAQCYFEE